MRNQLFTRTTGVFAAMATVIILAFAAVMTVSAQADGPEWKLPVTGLTAVAGDDPGEMLITWDAHPQTTKTLLKITGSPGHPTANLSRPTIRPIGTPTRPRTRFRLQASTPARPTRSGSAPGTTTTESLRWSEVATGQAAASAAPTNSAATGQPTITGTVEVGQTLTADTSAISDGNGLTSVAFSHQWVRSASGSDNDITRRHRFDLRGHQRRHRHRHQGSREFHRRRRLLRKRDQQRHGTSVPVPAPVIVPPEEPQIAQQAGDDGETLVLDTWSLIPSGLGVGDSFRLIFLSSTKRNASSSSIGTYNTFVQTALLPAMTTSRTTATDSR